MSEIVVTMAHVRAANLCSRGARQWFSKYGLDWSQFVREGLPASTLEATGDALAKKVCDIARNEGQK